MAGVRFTSLNDPSSSRKTYLPRIDRQAASAGDNAALTSKAPVKLPRYYPCCSSRHRWTLDRLQPICSAIFLKGTLCALNS